jgi:drug/metabolite transporter (DMT)-like permease
VAVLPLALAHGDVFGLSGTGWTYMLILTLTSGVIAQGLQVFAQKSIQIGTIGIAQVAQPALAVVWSFLVLGEVVNGRQITGIAIVTAGLLAFVALQGRVRPLRRPA